MLNEVALLEEKCQACFNEFLHHECTVQVFLQVKSIQNGLNFHILPFN